MILFSDVHDGVKHFLDLLNSILIGVVLLALLLHFLLLRCLQDFLFSVALSFLNLLLLLTEFGFHNLLGILLVFSLVCYDLWLFHLLFAFLTLLFGLTPLLGSFCLGIAFSLFEGLVSIVKLLLKR